MKKRTILVIDDEETITITMRHILNKAGYTVFTASSGEEGVEVFNKEKPQLVITDLMMDGIDGLEVLKQIKETTPETMVVILTGYGELNTAVEALRFGASDYLYKPCKADEILHRVSGYFEKMTYIEEIERLHRQLEMENSYLRDEVKSELAFGQIIGESPSIKRTLQQIDMVADTDATVLIHGETGTGKELVARAIHERSHRNKHPLIKVNCPSIPKELFESEFFGHVRGAFTGAIKERVGRFQLADGGTLFLDEISEIPLELQGKLLRVLQEGQFMSVGNDNLVNVNVRIIVATNRNLQEEVRRGNFREDLFFRLNLFPIEIKPLRDRVTDIKPLAEHFLKLACEKYNCHCKKEGITEQEHQKLIKYFWPGNVRELKSTVERAIIILKSENSNTKSLQFDFGSSSPELLSNPNTSADLKASPKIEDMDIKQLERKQIMDALIKSNWKIYGDRGAAKILNLKPTTLAYRIKKFKIEKPS